MKFLDSAHTVVLVGGPGTGKTHLATSLGIEVIRVHGRQMRFFSTVELINALELEKVESERRIQNKPHPGRRCVL